MSILLTLNISLKTFLLSVFDLSPRILNVATLRFIFRFIEDLHQSHHELQTKGRFVDHDRLQGFNPSCPPVYHCPRPDQVSYWGRVGLHPLPHQSKDPRPPPERPYSQFQFPCPTR